LPSTFTGLEIGKSALMAALRQMEVTGHNIANSATPGYSRQEVALEPIIQRQSINAGTFGLGVKVADVMRSRDKFVDAVLRNEMGKEAAFGAQKDVLQHLETVVAEPSDNGIRQAIDSFWAAWHDLASEPNSQAARAQVMERGRSLADTFRHLGGQLDSLSNDIEVNIEATVEKVNLLSVRIASLNLEISRAIARKEPIGDLADQRDLLLDELASLTGAAVTIGTDGHSVRPTVDGIALVDGTNVYKVEVVFTSTGAEFRVKTSETDHVVVGSMGGKLGGLKTSRDETVLAFKAELETLLRGFVDKVNLIHGQGFTVDTDPGTPGGPFFQVNADDYIGSIAVNPDIVADPRKIAASDDSSDPLDGSIALRIADWIATGRYPGDGIPLDVPVSTTLDYWRAAVGKIGVMGQKIEGGLATQELLVKELQNRRDSISGVSIDEEVALLVRQQHAFSAASRLISVADEMIDTIVNRMGLAGR